MGRIYTVPDTVAEDHLAEQVETNKRIQELVSCVEALTQVNRANNKQLEILTEVELTEESV